MTRAKGKDDFTAKWNDHLEQFRKLRHTLPADQWDELEENMSEMSDLIDSAAEELYGE
ncbi:hypothetical protein [Halomonas sp.]|uniref:hypothetical protein n=1 Tax=Halomonas sp. TaxID=1486246 RepID=UPI003563190E